MFLCKSGLRNEWILSNKFDQILSHLKTGGNKQEIFVFENQYSFGILCNSAGGSFSEIHCKGEWAKSLKFAASKVSFCFL